ncbi:MAG: septation protein SpoVG family protein [Pigeon pea little leaf phytoplasma]|uniref:Septation protein SpoVG family protein n=1 Tax=Candidatus Phytoplasma fabacearum TaxID=2982628 RepID=A0ABU8ZT03_9MOLU|nr:septation protein SpoVG family protein ['Bituminaria bituminosa' little leaf phytoplasma]MDV3148725.1 septation protein SpoVG family protein [Pigeon pea little leaf phytoplasma]MDO7983765.1 septation protein SpoVG family protein ['Bituminaria bituminosa' little leaf phytoplasma]MDO8024081.1 septation protein SpoVG family protein ['Bituminaria bituminosa' little leaf phytoplasma]MDO8030783.1 septation protein SpoVG family protein ['Bituminaria bituminosa' little leaf phytoplasma]MDV3154244.1
MKITGVRIKLNDKEHPRLKAVSSVFIDDCFVIHGVRIIRGNKGYFIAMPSSRLSTGIFKDIAHPTNTHTRNMLNERVLEEFYAKTSSNNADLIDSEQVNLKSENPNNNNEENTKNNDSNNEEIYNCD